MGEEPRSEPLRPSSLGSLLGKMGQPFLKECSWRAFHPNINHTVEQTLLSRWVAVARGDLASLQILYLNGNNTPEFRPRWRWRWNVSDGVTLNIGYGCKGASN